MPQAIRILIADDHTIVRTGLKTILSYQKGFKVVGEAENGEETVAAVKRLRPDVVVMDLMMPIMDGTQATATIVRDYPDTKVLILTTFTRAEGIVTALSAGAVGALTKTTTSAELSAAIRAAARGEKFVADEISQMLKYEPQLSVLTKKQLDILRSVMRGLTNEDIGQQFGISPNSVKKQLKSIFAKLNVANRAEAVALALEKHLLTPYP